MACPRGRKDNLRGGAVTASVIVASITDPTQCRSGRHLAASIGLAPKHNSSAGKERQGGISKRGNRTLRWLLVLGANALIHHARTKAADKVRWLKALLEHRSAELAAAAQANKTARVVLLVRGGTYHAPAATQTATAGDHEKPPPAIAAARGVARVMTT